MEVPSLKGELRELIARHLELNYVSEAPKRARKTANPYQSVRLDDFEMEGVRGVRDRFLDQIDFAGRSVLDLGSNLGELSRGARARGATLVDGFEYDPFFVELSRAIDAYGAVTRVSHHERDITDPAVYRDHYDVVLAFSVFVYIEPILEHVASITDQLLLFETHGLIDDDHFVGYYARVVGQHFPHYAILGESDWDVRRGGEGDRRAVVAFAKDEPTLLEVLKEGPAGVAPPNVVRTAVARRPGKRVEPRLLEVDLTRPPREALQQRFFMMFRFDSLEELFEAVDRMEIDVDTLAKSREIKNLGSEGWVYWFLFTKGYVQYLRAGEVAEGNVYFDYLTRHYIEQGHDPGALWDLTEHGLAVERVARRYRDLDWLREEGARGPHVPAGTKPVRVTVSDRPRDPPLHVYEVGAEGPLPVRHVDGWHRLFSARLSGLASFPCETVPENLHDKPIRGEVEQFSFDGTRLRAVGWAVDPELPVNFELRTGRLILATGAPRERPDVAERFPQIAHARASGFEIDIDCPLPGDAPMRFDLVVMHEIFPVGVIRLLHVPGDPTAAPTNVYQLLQPLVRRTGLDSFDSILAIEGDGSAGEPLGPALERLVPAATVMTIAVGDQEKLGKAGMADLVIAHAVLPSLTRDAQSALLEALRDVVSDHGFVAVTVRGELVRPFLTSPETANELDSDGISDRDAGGGETVQTKEYTLDACSALFEVVDYVVGGVGNVYDLVVLRKRSD